MGILQYTVTLELANVEGFSLRKTSYSAFHTSLVISIFIIPTFTLLIFHGF